MYKVTIIGTGTNQANRLVRYFSNKLAAQEYIDGRSQTDAPGTVTTMKRIKVHD